MAEEGWRFIAERLDGNGNGVLIDADLPLQGSSVVTRVSGYSSIGGTITPAIARLISEVDGLPVLLEWSTAIYAEYNGEIRAGCIVTDTTLQDEEIQITSMGFAGYAKGMPYTASNYWIDVDPLFLARHIWTHLQSQPGGNLGLQVDAATATPVRRGTALTQVEFDTQAGPVSFEAGPYRLAWYQTDDLGKELDDLATETPFDFRERHEWVGETDSIAHYLDFGYPTLGSQREGLRFVEGENIRVPPSRQRRGERFASEVLVLGAGEGSAMKRGESTLDRGSRLRRVAVVADKQLSSTLKANARARQEVAARQSKESVEEIVVTDTDAAPFGSWNDGDMILLTLDSDWGDIDVWVRVLATTYSPEAGTASLTVRRTDMLDA